MVKMKFVFTGCLMLVLLAMSCSDESKTGTLVVRMTDSPGDYEEVNVDIQAIQVTSSDDDSGWSSLAGVNTGVFNLLDLSDGTETVLTSSSYPAGRVGQIRLMLGDNNTVKVDGTTYALTTPSAQQSGLKLLVDEELAAGVTYAVLLDFDAARSVVKTGNGSYILKPVIRVVSEAQDGAIEGSVLPAEENVAVFAIIGEDTLASSYVPSGSIDFFLGGLAEGNYKVTFDPGELSDYQGALIEEVSVTVGSVTGSGTTELALK